MPRPEITGNDLRDLIFFIRRHSLPSVRSNVLPGPDHFDTSAPIITEVVAEEIGPQSIQISWRTSEPTLGVVEFGAAPSDSRWSQIENSYTTNHSVLLEDVLPGTNQYYSIIAKDVAGNTARVTREIALGSDDVVIDFGPADGTWKWMNDSAFVPLHGLSPEVMAVGDLDGSREDDVVIGFGPADGTWKWMNDSTWVALHGSSAEVMAVGNLDGN